MSNKNNDNVIQLFPKDLPHITEGKLTYNPHRLLIRDDDNISASDKLRRSLEKINKLMQDMTGGKNEG